MDSSHPSAEELYQRLSEFDLIDYYPFVSDGVRNWLKHSLLQSSYVLLAQQYDINAAVEVPIYNESLREMSGDKTDRRTSEKADTVWFDQNGAPTVAVEVERFGKDPENKARNLIKYSRSEPDLEAGVLHYFDTIGHSPDLKTIRKILNEGDMEGPVQMTLQTKVIIVETVFSEQNGKYVHSYTDVIDMISPYDQ